MSEKDEKELIDFYFDNKNRIGNKEIKIVPPDGIKSITLSYNFVWDLWYLAFERKENINGIDFTCLYNLVIGDKYIAYKSENLDGACFIRDKSEFEVIKIALAFTAEELNKLADNAQ